MAIAMVPSPSLLTTRVITADILLIRNLNITVRLCIGFPVVKYVGRGSRGPFQDKHFVGILSSTSRFFSSTGSASLRNHLFNLRFLMVIFLTSYLTNMATATVNEGTSIAFVAISSKIGALKPPPPPPNKKRTLKPLSSAYLATV